MQLKIIVSKVQKNSSNAVAMKSVGKCGGDKCKLG